MTSARESAAGLPAVDVLLATYRPHPGWLETQVGSVRAQRGVAVNLLLREDNDGLGASSNFSELLKQSRAGYAAFCDQDDVWAPDKLESEMAEMRRLEKIHGGDVPLMVFCESEVVDADLRPCGLMNIARQGVDVESGLSVNRLAMQNFIPGHTMLINARLRSLAGEIPCGAVMYDYWVALTAAAFGKIGFVARPLVKYRQHSGNAVGSSRRSGGIAEFRRRLADCVLQAKAFVERFGTGAPRPLAELAAFDRRSWLGRRVSIVRNGLYKHGLARNLMLFAFA